MKALSPQTANCAVKPKRILSPKFRKPKQKDRGVPKFLTEDQVEHLIQCTYKHGQKAYRKRNALILFMLFRHGFRRNELLSLKWSQINLKDAQIHIYRLKNGKMSIHPLTERELRMIGEHKKTCASSVYVFTNKDGIPLKERGLSFIIDEVTKKSHIPYKVHPHMFRHGCGFYLANKGIDTRAIQEYLGHRDINKTVIYTEMAPNRFNAFWKD